LEVNNIEDKKRVKFTTNLDEDLLKQLKKLAIDLDKRHNELLEEAIQDLLRKYGKKGKQ
jgi:predicted transcriptional regulator